MFQNICCLSLIENPSNRRTRTTTDYSIQVRSMGTSQTSRRKARTPREQISQTPFAPRQGTSTGLGPLWYYMFSVKRHSATTPPTQTPQVFLPTNYAHCQVGRYPSSTMSLPRTPQPPFNHSFTLSHLLLLLLLLLLLFTCLLLSFILFHCVCIWYSLFLCFFLYEASSSSCFPHAHHAPAIPQPLALSSHAHISAQSAH